MKEHKRYGIEQIDIDAWDVRIPDGLQRKAVAALEEGKVLYFPHLAFQLNSSESGFLNPKIADPKSKNISFNGRKDSLSGMACSEHEMPVLKSMMQRYAGHSKQL